MMARDAIRKLAIRKLASGTLASGAGLPLGM
jgi:hypothetical protein